VPADFAQLAPAGCGKRETGTDEQAGAEQGHTRYQIGPAARLQAEGANHIFGRGQIAREILWTEFHDRSFRCMKPLPNILLRVAAEPVAATRRAATSPALPRARPGEARDRTLDSQSTSESEARTHHRRRDAAAEHVAHTGSDSEGRVGLPVELCAQQRLPSAGNVTRSTGQRDEILPHALALLEQLARGWWVGTIAGTKRHIGWFVHVRLTNG
jgi:hypothetical protein